MKTNQFFRIVSVLVFSAFLALAVDLVFAFFEKPLSLFVYFALFVGFATIFIVLKAKPPSLWVYYIFALIVIGLALLAVVYFFKSNAGYRSEDDGKELLYGSRDVMVLVPHEDDEIIVAGGVIEEYINYGSTVHLVFVTNGDASASAETRLGEALAVAESLGVASNNVHFMGYGDRAAASMYSSPGGVLVESIAGYSATYAVDDHPAYNPGNPYIRENLLGDLVNIILSIKPDVIYCTEIEEHPDHTAVSLFLDEAMESILKSSDDYTPIIMKSSCYATTFHAVNDFYNLNILATQAPVGNEHWAGIYNWSDRIRLPVYGGGLSRSIFGCDTFEHLRLYKSQRVYTLAEGMVNGDRVFWLRDTQSLCYDAQIETSSGYGKFLNDYKICDTFDVYRGFTYLGDNTWEPDADDTEKKATVTLAEPSYIQRICLYDDPSEARVLNALITFDDGSSIETDMLNDTGPTEIEVNQDNVSSFTIEILETQGEGAGITEIEAYRDQRDYGFNFIKLTDMNGNFIYDYFVGENGTAKFKIYNSGVKGEFRVSGNNSRCPVSYEGGIITVKCPKDQSCTISVSSEDGKYSDTAVVSNPGRFMRETGPYIEKLVRQFTKVNMQQSNTYVLLRDIYHAIR